MMAMQLTCAGAISGGFSVGKKQRVSLWLAAVICLFAAAACAQDSPSLGDLARQQRLQKEKSKTAQGKDAKTSKVITNEEIHAKTAIASQSAAAADEHPASNSASTSTNEVKQSAESWTAQIQTQKTQVASLEKQIGAIKDSIQFAPPNCVENCVQWNELQQEKQRQAEGMQTQLDEMKKHLEEMQDSARKQGYGSSVYDP
jgi:hypothetical protein